jgi:hypothetical protein
MVKRVVNPAFLLLISLPIALVLNVFILLNDPVVVAPHHVNMTGENAYFRPSGDEVSGFKNSLVKNHRSPCPALNALANHGYLPRDGTEVTPRLLQRALVKVYNLDASLAEFLVSTLPAQFTLADLGEHHFIEHDASLAHDDAWKGRDPSSGNTTLSSDLLSRGDHDNHLTKVALATFRRERESDSAANSPDFKETFTAERELTAYSEVAVLLLVMGDYDTRTIAVDRARSFLVEERIPANYHKPKTPVTLFQALWVTFQLRVLALLGPVLASTW